MKNILGILILATLFTGCEKIVDLKYKSNTSKIIIEGNVTNESGPYFVKLTKSISLKNTDSYPTIDNATVTISDDAGNNETLTPQGDGMYSTSTLAGVEGRTYTLTVQTDNQTYTAQSTMPQQVPFDTIKVDEITSPGGEKEYNLIPVYHDPSAQGNNYRFVLTVNNKIINQHFIQNDNVRNGEINTLRLEINDGDLKLKSTDTVVIAMQCVDGSIATFYRALALIADSGPGGGTTPNNPPNNISNGALGLFSAYTVQKRMSIVP